MQSDSICCVTEGTEPHQCTGWRRKISFISESTNKMSRRLQRTTPPTMPPTERERKRRRLFSRL